MINMHLKPGELAQEFFFSGGHYVRKRRRKTLGWYGMYHMIVASGIQLLRNEIHGPNLDRNFYWGSMEWGKGQKIGHIIGSVIRSFLFRNFGKCF